MGRFVSLLAACVLGLAACGGDDEDDARDTTVADTTTTPTATVETTPDPPAAEPGGDCGLETVRDRFIGFRIGRPSGWQMDATGGSIVVKEDPAGRTLAIVYPVIPEGGGDQVELFRSYGRVLAAAAKGNGGGLRFKIEENSERGVFGSVRGTFAGGPVEGRASVTPLEDQIVFSTYWAPPAEIDSEQAELAEIIACYRKEQGVPLRRHQGQFFAASLPEDWRVTGETQNGIDISAPGDDAGVSFAYVTNIPGATEADGFRDYTLGSIPGLSDIRFQAVQDLGTSTDGLGTEWSQRASEFTASFEGRRVRGVVSVAVANTQYGSSGGLSSIRVAEVGKYDEFAGVIAAIQESIVLTSAPGGGGGSGVALAPNRPDDNPLTSSSDYRNEVQDQLSQDWQEATMGFDNVESPSTGDQYQVPLNSYDPAGPDGPGYYRELPGGGGSELLEESAP